MKCRPMKGGDVVERQIYQLVAATPMKGRPLKGRRRGAVSVPRLPFCLPR